MYFLKILVITLFKKQMLNLPFFVKFVAKSLQSAETLKFVLFKQFGFFLKSPDI